jgi:hypothetical protein
MLDEINLLVSSTLTSIISSSKKHYQQFIGVFSPLDRAVTPGKGVTIFCVLVLTYNGGAFLRHLVFPCFPSYHVPASTFSLSLSNNSSFV